MHLFSWTEKKRDGGWKVTLRLCYTHEEEISYSIWTCHQQKLIFLNLLSAPSWSLLLPCFLVVFSRIKYKMHMSMFLFLMVLKKYSMGKTPLIFKLAWLGRKEPRCGEQVVKLWRGTEIKLNCESLQEGRERYRGCLVGTQKGAWFVRLLGEFLASERAHANFVEPYLLIRLRGSVSGNYLRVQTPK